MRTALLALALCITPSVSLAQRLRQASEAARTGRSDRSERSARGSDNSSPTPSRSSSSSRSYRHWLFRPRRFLPFPYAWGYPGYAAPTVTASAPSTAHQLAFTATLSGSYVFDAIASGHAALQLSVASLVIAVQYDLYVEPSAHQTDLVALGRYRLGAALIDASTIRGNLFAGMIHWADSDGSLFGLEAGFALDVFAGSPVVISLTPSAGVFGRAVLVGARVSLGFMLHHVELQLGWHHESVIPLVSGDPVLLTGPFVGVRFWN